MPSGPHPTTRIHERAWRYGSCSKPRQPDRNASYENALNECLHVRLNAWTFTFDVEWLLSRDGQRRSACRCVFVIREPREEQRRILPERADSSAIVVLIDPTNAGRIDQQALSSSYRTAVPVGFDLCEGVSELTRGGYDCDRVDSV